MTHHFEIPYNEPPPRPPGSRVHPAGVVLGFFIAPFGLVLTGLLGALVPVGGALGFIGVLVAAIVLVTRPEPFARGIGVGMLSFLGLMILLAGACFAILASSEL